MAWKCVKYSLDNLVNSLSGCIFQRKCRYYTKCKDCKNIKSVRMVAWNVVSSVKIEKICEIIVKNATNCKCHLEQAKVENSCFIFECLECEKKNLLEFLWENY